MKKYDAVVVGSGPNGLAAAIRLAQSGHSVLVLEAAETAGGGMRTEPLTQPGFVHDVCSAVYPLAVASPFFRTLNLEKFGLEWIHSPSVVAHPLEEGKLVLLEKTVDATAEHLGEDAKNYRKLMNPLVQNWDELLTELFKPLFHWPRHPLLLSRFGLRALFSAAGLAQEFLRTSRARALFMGVAAHANAPLEKSGTAAIGLMLHVAAHARGWPFPKGGAQNLARALVACLQSYGGEVQTGHEVKSLKDLPKSRWVFLDLTPQQILSLFGNDFPAPWKKSFEHFRYGPGVFKMDWALSSPIPWAAKDCSRAATVHIGGSMEDILLSESGNARGVSSDFPFVLLSQPSLFDSSRAPAGFHTAWAYCHVPAGSVLDRQEVIENQIERFAPGFRDCILARSALSPADLQKKNANLIGGDISGGAINLRQLLFRPTLKRDPYRLPMPGFYICSSSTPPGPGVHGMCGFNAVQSALSH